MRGQRRGERGPLVKAGGSLYIGLTMLAMAGVVVGILELIDGDVLTGSIPLVLGLAGACAMTWFYRLPVRDGHRDFET